MMTQNIIEICDEIEKSANKVYEEAHWFLHVDEVSKINDPVVRMVLEKAFAKAGNDMMEVCNMLKSVTKAMRLSQ